MTKSRLIALLPAFLVLGGAIAVANAQQAVVEGAARSEDGGAPVAFALVRLLPADSTARRSGQSAQGITSADGRYRFADVAAGVYRVQLLRIGFRPVLSEPIQVAAGETAQLSLRVISQPLELPPVIVRASECLTGDALVAHPRVFTLWQQARNGASIREGLVGRYRFRTLLREEGFELRADGPTPASTFDRQLISDPRWALRNAARLRELRLRRGYYAPNDGWGLPNELDVLHEDFLRAHCMETTAEYGEGEIGLRFRPLRVRRNFLDVRGTIWLDSASYLARRIDFEYVDGDQSRGTVRLDFDDIAAAGGTLRMPIGGVYAMRPSRQNPAKRTEGKLTYTYTHFEEVPPR
jgi:hypothetical protein